MLHTYQVSWPSHSGGVFLKGFYHIWAWRHLGHVTSIISSDFHFLVTERFHEKFGSDRHSSL